MSTHYERLDASDPIDQASELEQMQLRIALENQKATRATLHPKLAEVTDKKKNTVRVACLPLPLLRRDSQIHGRSQRPRRPAPFLR